MAKPVAEWTEDDVLSLPSGENDAFERKGSRLLDLTIAGVDENEVRDELAKQLSAFANTEGGRIIYGLTNGGAVDNQGIARVLRGRQPTKEWLEDLIATLTDFEIVGVNVYEIPPKAAGSSLAPNKSLYVVDVPESERAPHQSRRDFRYYVRLGGRSSPASHRLVEDIRNRARHPKVEVRSLRLQNAVPGASREPILGLKSSFELHLGFACDLVNDGAVRAGTSCLQVSATIPVSTCFMNDPECFTRSAAKGTVLIEMKNPLYPKLGCPLGFYVAVSAEVEVLQHGERLMLAGVDPRDVRLFITTFADSAPARKQEFKLTDVDPEGLVGRLIQQKVNEIRHASRSRGERPPHTGPWS